MEQEDYLKSDTNRLEYFVDDIISKSDADERMLALTEILTETEIVPDVGRYYTFVYAAKTPRMRYDEFPLVAVIGLFKWGFRGINYHLNKPRNYTWDEVVGYLHLIYPLELTDARSIPYQSIQINN